MKAAVMNVLDVKNLTIEFKSEHGFLPAVTDVSFHLQKGEILALVGESGCGKSISCMSLSRLLPSPPARIPRGEVLLTKRDGTPEDVMKLPPRQLRKIPAAKSPTSSRSPRSPSIRSSASEHRLRRRSNCTVRM